VRIAVESDLDALNTSHASSASRAVCQALTGADFEHALGTSQRERLDHARDKGPLGCDLIVPGS
jgi:hypothetical protein